MCIWIASSFREAKPFVVFNFPNSDCFVILVFIGSPKRPACGLLCDEKTVASPRAPVLADPKNYLPLKSAFRFST